MKYYFILDKGEVAALVRARTYGEFVQLAGLMIDEGYHIKEVSKEEYNSEERTF